MHTHFLIFSDVLNVSNVTTVPPYDEPILKETKVEEAEETSIRKTRSNKTSKIHNHTIHL